MAILNVAVLALTLTSTLLRSNCAPIGQSNETQPTLPYYCSAEESSGSTLDLINYLRYSVNNPIVLNCPSPTCHQLRPHDINEYHLQGLSLELETFRGVMKLTLDGPCAVLEKKAAVLPLKYFDHNSTKELEYCKDIECIFKEATRHIAKFVMGASCGCNNTCEYNPGRIDVPIVPEGQEITIHYLATQQWASLSNIIVYLYQGTPLL